MRVLHQFTHPTGGLVRRGWTRTRVPPTSANTRPSVVRWTLGARAPAAEHAGHAVTTLMVDDLDERMTAIADRGIEPALRETYDDGVRKTTYIDPDGNRFAFGEVPAEAGED